METLGEFIETITEKNKLDIVKNWESSGLLFYLSEPSLKNITAFALEQSAKFLTEIDEKIILEIKDNKLYGENYSTYTYTKQEIIPLVFPTIRRVIEHLYKKSNDYIIIKSIVMSKLIKSMFDEFDTFKNEYGSIFYANIDVEVEYCAWFSKKYAQLLLEQS